MRLCENALDNEHGMYRTNIVYVMIISSHSNRWVNTLGRDKMVAISQATFSTAFCWMKMYEFRINFHRSLFLRVQLTISQHWLAPVMAWRRSGDKPLSQPMLVSLLTHICVTRPQSVKTYCSLYWFEWWLLDCLASHFTLNPVLGDATICHQVHCMRWGHRSLFMQSRILYKMACMGDVIYRLIWMKLISMLSMYVQPGTYRHFRWRIIAVLPRGPTVLMFVDITSAPKLQRKYAETWVFVAVSEEWPLGKTIRGSSYYMNQSRLTSVKLQSKYKIFLSRKYTLCKRASILFRHRWVKTCKRINVNV